MPNLTDLLASGKAANGTKALLEEIRKHQKDMPEEVRDDMTFGALLVLFDMGQNRGLKLNIINFFMFIYGALFALIFLVIIALHGNVPWLTNLFANIFGV